MNWLLAGWGMTVFCAAACAPARRRLSSARRRRLRELREDSPAGHGRPSRHPLVGTDPLMGLGRFSSSARARPRPGLGYRFLAALGRIPRSLLGFSPDRCAEHRLGGALAALALGSIVDLRFGVLAAGGIWLWMFRRRLRERQVAASALRQSLPEALDLFALAASAGLSVRQALAEVAPRMSGVVGEALQDACRRIGAGVDVAEALEEMSETFGEPLRELVRPLVNALRYGVPLSESLAAAAAQSRLNSRREAERVARVVPFKLLLPLTVCVLPAFVLLTIVPSLANSLDFLNL